MPRQRNGAVATTRWAGRGARNEPRGHPAAKRSARGPMIGFPDVLYCTEPGCHVPGEKARCMFF